MPPWPRPAAPRRLSLAAARRPPLATSRRLLPAASRRLLPAASRRLLVATSLPVVAILAVGCGPPPEPARTPDPPAQSTAPGGHAPSSPAPTGAGVPVTPSNGFGEQVAIECAGRPGAEEVLAVLRSEELLGRDAEAEVTVGPLCAGTWQYAVVTVPDLDPLQVVTRGEPDALELVTAGTDVCSVEVRIQAPPGIRTAASCLN